MALGGFFVAVSLLGIWLLTLFAAWNQTKKRQQSDHLNRALALWPLALVDSIVALSNVPDWYAIAGVFHFVPIIIAAMLLHHLHQQMQPKAELSKWGSIAIVVIAALSELPMLFHPPNFNGWIDTAPFADIKAYWWLYLPYLCASGAMMIVAGRMVDICRRYHTYLPWQAVDIQRYQCFTMTIVSVLLLLLSLAALTVVIFVSAGVVFIKNWPLIIDITLALCLLLTLVRCIVPHNILPSPLDYNALFNLKASSKSADEALVAKAEKVMISSRSYKAIGLTIKDFSTLVGTEPTALARALKRVKRKEFRGFIFHFRMEYARNVVMRSDASIASVAKRLGFHSEKFLSGPFLHYLEKRR